MIPARATSLNSPWITLLGHEEPLSERLDRGRYLLQHLGLAALLTPLMRLGHLVLAPQEGPAPQYLVPFLQKRFERLLARDISHVQAGLYPRELLFQFPWRAYVRQLPGSLWDMPRVIRRRNKQHYDELPDSVDLHGYPSYYRRTFHWQTDGWLSEESARRYDLGVELLFSGTADIMRRMGLAVLVPELRGLPQPRLLDVACGTGRFLLQAHKALPQAKLYGLDLSPYYIVHARRLLRTVPDVSLVVENAETLPFRQGVFDAVSSIFLLHELPSDARRRVLKEAHRVLRPGGLVMVCDSVQLSDSPEFAPLLSAFPQLYHEPYYKGYIQDDLTEMLGGCGFEKVKTEVHFVSKVVVGRKT